MKKPLLILSLFLLTNTGIINGQCIANAGPDIVVCTSWGGIDTVQIGGSPIVIGGVPPYSIIWETFYQVTIGQNTITYTASDFLDDTTIANPSIIYSVGDPLEFILTITDANGIICKDSANINFSNFGITLGYLTHFIQQGDSVQLNFSNVIGGIPPLQYLWQPNHGLTDSTSLAPWATPDTSTSYYITVTDSAGCSATGTPAHNVVVSPVSINNIISTDNNFLLYPNPSKDFIVINILVPINETAIIEIHNLNGQLLENIIIMNNQIFFSTASYPKGTYTCRVSVDNKYLETAKFIIE